MCFTLVQPVLVEVVVLHQYVSLCLSDSVDNPFRLVIWVTVTVSIKCPGILDRKGE